MNGNKHLKLATTAGNKVKPHFNLQAKAGQSFAKQYTFTDVTIRSLLASVAMVLSPLVVECTRGLGRTVICVMLIKHVTDITEQPLLYAWSRWLIIIRSANISQSGSVDMRKLAPVRVSYWKYFLISYQVIKNVRRSVSVCRVHRDVTILDW